MEDADDGYNFKRPTYDRLQSKLRKTLVTKLPSYEIVTPPIGIIYYDA
jgi:hypothetical protein